jgi:hypothetical protein
MPPPTKKGLGIHMGTWSLALAFMFSASGINAFLCLFDQWNPYKTTREYTENLNLNGIRRCKCINFNMKHEINACRFWTLKRVTGRYAPKPKQKDICMPEQSMPLIHRMWFLFKPLFTLFRPSARGWNEYSTFHIIFLKFSRFIYIPILHM